MLDPVRILKELVQINSVNPFRTETIDGKEYGIGNEEEINLFLESTLRSLGFEVYKQVYQEEINHLSHGTTKKIPKRWNLLAKKGNFNKSLMFLAHTDTADIKEGWETDPFEGEEKLINGEKRFYALGANDMKSGIAAILAAQEGLIPKDYNIKIAFVTDEEFWSFGAEALLSDPFLDDVKICIVPELMEAADKGQPFCIGLGRLGRAEYQFEVRGVACHGSDAFISSIQVNAVHQSVLLQAELLNYIEASKKTFKEGELNVINYSFISLQLGGQGTLSVPDKASFVLDRGLLPGENAEKELEKIKEFLKQVKKKLDSRVKLDVKLRYRPTPPCEPYFISEEQPLTKCLKKEILKIEKAVRFGIGRSVADENRIAALGIPTFILPPRGADSHTSREWVDLESLAQLTLIFRVLSASAELADQM